MNILLKRVVENYLTNVSEIEIDYPFRILLESMGFLCLDIKTIHSPLEKGKDIPAYNKKEKLYYFFQTKVGNINRSIWADFNGQLMQLSRIRPLIANCPPDAKFQPVFVTTGDVTPSINETISLQNDGLIENGKLPIIVWNRNDLIDKFYNNFYKIFYKNQEFVAEFIIYLSLIRKKGFKQKSTVEFFNYYLNSFLVNNNRKRKKIIATYLMLAFNSLNPYVNDGNITSAIDHMNTLIVIFCNYVLKNNFKEKEYLNEYKILVDYLRKLLKIFYLQIRDFCKLNNDLVNMNIDMSEVFQYPLRVHSVLSKLVLFNILTETDSEDSKKVNSLIDIIIQNNSTAFEKILSESQQATLIITLLWILKNKELSFLKHIISNIFDYFLQHHDRKNGGGLLSPYAHNKDIVIKFMGHPSYEEPIESSNFESYFLINLINFCCLIDYKEVLSMHWNKISRFFNLEYIPEDEIDLFEFRATKGKIISWQFPLTGQWSEIKSNFLKNNLDVYPFLRNNKEMLYILTLAYPWRISGLFYSYMIELIKA